MSSLNEAIVERLRARRKSTYMVGARDLSFAELGADVGALAAYFDEAGMKGRRLLLISRSDRVLLTSFFAALLKGVTSVILDPAAPVPELEVLVAAADADGVIADRAILDSLDAAGALQRTSVRHAVGSDDLGAKRGGFRIFGGRSKPADLPADDIAGIIAARNGEQITAEDVDDEAIAYILFTSGTTSRPKGVMISHRALHAQMRTFIANYGLSAEATVMNLLPFHHTDGLTQGAVMCLLAGSKFVRPYRFSPDKLPQMLTDLYRHSVTHLVTVPSVLALSRALDNSLSDAFRYPEFQFVISTAAPLDGELWQSCEARFGIQIVNVYGLTETVCETMYCGPDAANRRLGSVGRPIDSRAKIVDADGGELGDEAEGELLVAGEHIMTGYFNDPEATAAVLKDGWFHTGDIARRDRDGFYFIVGRKKDLIISGGINIYPEDVNGVLRSIAGVLDAVTFGLPDPLWGERAVSCVICDKAADPSVEAISQSFLARASRQKLPREIVKLDEFPRGPAGKVVMSEVRELFNKQSEKFRGVAECGGNDVQTQVYTVAAGVLGCPPDHLSPDSQSETVPNWTSLNHVEMMLALEMAFGFKFSTREIMKFRSIGDAIDIVRSRTAA
jgi:long-chain acyl-CoA synthetase